MEQEINENKFLEHGDHSGNLYGTHLDSIRDVIKQGELAIPFTHFKNKNIPNFFPRQNVCFGLRT